MPKTGYESYSESALDEDELQDIQDAEAVVYWYGSGYYSGAGYAFIKTKDGWLDRDLRHCSCNGPSDYLNLRLVDPETFEPLPALLARMSDELRAEVQPLVDCWLASGGTFE